MVHRNLAFLLALTLSLELIISPVQLANASETANSSKNSPKTNTGTMEALGTGIRVLGDVWNAYNQSKVPPMNPAEMEKFRQQQTPIPDKFFNTQTLMQIPGLANYLALSGINPARLNCSTLPTTLNEVKSELCRVGMTEDQALAPPMKLQQMYTYYDQYYQISKLYQNFSADSNADGQAFGIGCMNNAMNILNGFFKYRTDELDKLLTNLEAMQNAFREASRSDLDAIEEAVAVLDGDSAMADKVRSKRPDLFDFKKRFDNPACNSMYAGDALNERGRKGGLNLIDMEIDKILNQKAGRYSGASYAQSHTTVLEDINSLAERASKQMELNFAELSKNPNAYGKFLVDLPELISSPIGSNRALSPDLFSDIRTKFNDSFLKLTDQRNTVLAELRAAGVPGDAAINLLGNAASNNFESEVFTIENNLKNKCLADTIGEMGRERLLDKIYDPTVSNHANKFASNFLKDRLLKILDNKETSLEKKLNDLKLLEAQNGGRYFMRMENSYSVDEVDANNNITTRVEGASTVRTPTAFFSDIISNCNAQFKANKLDNKLTGQGAIQKLRELNQEYKNLAKNQAIDIKKEIRKRMIECNSPEEANNTIPGSCTPERFNNSSPGFCANAALSCSKNMQACNKQVDDIVKDIKEKKTARVNNYKALVAKNKQDIVKIFDSALSRYMQDGEVLRSIFGAGFSSPAGIKREVPENQRYLSEFQQATARSPDGRLLLEDPDKYVAMFKENINLLKRSVKDQQNQILGGETVGKNPGLLADHIKKTEKNYSKVASEASQFSEECIASHDRAVQAAEQARARQREDYDKRMSELGEKRDEFCSMYGMIRENPQAMCGELQSDFFKDASKAAALSGDQAAARRDISDLSNYCAQFGSFNEKSNGSSYSAEVLCQNAALDRSIVLADTALKDRIKKLCDERDSARKNCKPADRSTFNHCDDDYQNSGKQIEAAYVVAKQNSSSSLADSGLSEAPAYCNSGYNSNNRFAKGIEFMGNEISNALRSSSGQ